MNEHEDAAAVRRPPKLWVKLIGGLAILLTVWQVFASFLWIAPYSPLREVVPGNLLSSYMLPFFGQSWSVFAPEPINGDYHFNVRATLERDGESVETGWVSATDVELSIIEYNLLAPRAGIVSTDVASSFKGAYDALGSNQRSNAAEDFTGDDWEDALYTSLTGGTVDADGSDLTGDAADAAKIDDYLASERQSVAYATQVARAMWGDEVVAVQYRVSRQNIVPFADRNDPLAERPEPQIATTGWRPQLVQPGQSDENFARTFRAQYDRISQ